jgi:ATP-dependent protease HslVU (ClpYQ) ATPase subunit
MVFEHMAVRDINGERVPGSKLVKVKDLKQQVVMSFATQLYNLIDVEDFVKNEIETKGIVVIDEIDKLAQNVSR